MSKPRYLSMVVIVDCLRDRKPLKRLVCKSSRAASNWGAIQVARFAEDAQMRGEEEFSFDYDVSAVEYLDN